MTVRLCGDQRERLPGIDPDYSPFMSGMTLSSTDSTTDSTTRFDARDIGLLVLRVVFGGFLAVHGTQKLFGWFGGFGWHGTSTYFESMGYHPGTLFATMAGVTELGGGLLLLLGLVTPLAAAAVIGVMINATQTMWSGGFFAGTGHGSGAESPLTFAAVGLAVAFLGAGRFSVDNGRFWRREGIGWGIASVTLAIVASLLTFALKAAL